jgi:hypothetical protein
MCYGHLYKEFADLKLILSRKIWNRAGLNPIKTDFVDWLLIGQRRTKEDEQHMSVD